MDIFGAVDLERQANYRQDDRSDLICHDGRPTINFKKANNNYARQIRYFNLALLVFAIWLCLLIILRILPETVILNALNLK